MLIGTYVFAWAVYIRLVIFLKPRSSSDSDDHFFNQNMTEFEKRREMIRRQFSPRYCWFNVVFIYILVILTERTAIYIGLRLTSWEKMYKWSQIRPIVFYLTYATDLLIVVGILYFIRSSTNLKDT